jgi:hypothetical protein
MNCTYDLRYSAAENPALRSQREGFPRLWWKRPFYSVLDNAKPLKKIGLNQMPGWIDATHMVFYEKLSFSNSLNLNLNIINANSDHEVVEFRQDTADMSFFAREELGCAW